MIFCNTPSVCSFSPRFLLSENTRYPAPSTPVVSWPALALVLIFSTIPSHELARTSALNVFTSSSVGCVEIPAMDSESARTIGPLAPRPLLARFVARRARLSSGRPASAPRRHAHARPQLDAIPRRGRSTRTRSTRRERACVARRDAPRAPSPARAEDDRRRFRHQGTHDGS